LLPRRESLALAGGRAARLVLGTIPMLIIAGTIEGFLSPSDIATPLKFLFAGVMFAALVAYLNLKPRDSSLARAGNELSLTVAARTQRI
jgi:hypothetical protein